MKIINVGFQEFLEENVKDLTTGMPWLKDRTTKLITTVDEIKTFVDEAIIKGKCALDLEATGLNTRMKKTKDAAGRIIQSPADPIVGFCLSYDSKYGIYIPIRHKEEPECNLPEQPVIAEIRRLCLNCITVYHNAKYDLAQLRNVDIIIDDYRKIEDTLILARLYDAGNKDNKLKHLSERLINQKMIELSDMNKEKRLDFVSPKIGYLYGCSDAICTLDLEAFFAEQQIIKDQKAIYNLEKRVLFAVLDMENQFVKINVPYLQELKKKSEVRIAEIEHEIHKLAGREFNLASTQQLGKLLFDELKFTFPGVKTKTGQYSTDDATLEKIQDTYPIVKKIMEFRTLKKVLGTYIENLLLNHDEDDCVKLGFNQNGTDTGRFSSPGGEGINDDGYSGVNVQSIPKKPDPDNPEIDMRKSFIPRPGYKMVAADYENEEMKVAANLSNEPVWIEAARNGIDFHRATGALITGKNIKDVTDEERQLAKTTNFLSLYGGGMRNLSIQAHISEMEARRVLNSFYANLPTLKGWMSREVAKSRKTKDVKTAFGRTRPLHRYYDSGDKALAAHGDRCVANSMIQGGSADIMKTVMVRLHLWIKKYNLQDDIRILLTMHDELVFEIKEDKLDMYIPEIVKKMMLKDILQERLKWPIPLTVEVKVGTSWRVKEKYLETHPELIPLLDEPERDFSFQNQFPNRYTMVMDKEPAQDLAALKDSTSTPVVEPSIVAPDVLAAKSDSTAAEIAVEILPASDNIPEKISNAEKISEILSPEIIPKPFVDNEILIYTIRNRSRATLRWLNNIISFFVNDVKRYSYTGEMRILRIRDADGNNLMVSEFKIPVESFISLAKFFEL